MRPAPFALCFVAFLSAPAIGVAQPAPTKASTDALTDQARELHVKGAGLYDQGQYDKAEAAFLAAWALKKHHQIAANLGACEVKLGKYRDAAEHLAFFLREQPQSGNQDERQRTQALFDQVRPKVGAVTIKVDMPGTIVTVDGHEVGTSPLPAEVYVEPGRRTIEAVRAGDPGARATVDVGAGETREVTLALKRVPDVPPVERPSPTPGGPNAKILIAGGSVTGAALVTGVVLAVLAQRKGTDADTLLARVPTSVGSDPCQTNVCSTINDDRRAHDALAKGTIGALVGAGAIGGTTLAYALLARRLSSRHGTTVAPVVGTHVGGVAVLGAW
jgi:hypothetical protein